MSLPLEGILVADFSRVLAGPLATVMLADLGAKVIKVERPGQGDDTRHWGPPWVAGSSSYFECANRSKKSVELDLGDDHDRALAVELAARADIVVENFREGTLERRGLGYERVARTNPGVVYCSITGFGSHAGADLPGYDFLVQAVGGLMSITGPEDGDPTKVGVALVDVLTSKDAVIGILAALRAREVHGVGQRVEVNLLSSLLGSLANQASSLPRHGRRPVPDGQQAPLDRSVRVAALPGRRHGSCCGNDTQFRALTKELGVPERGGRPPIRDQRRSCREPRARWSRSSRPLSPRDSVSSWVERLTKAGVPAGKVDDIAGGLRPRRASRPRTRSLPSAARHPSRCVTPSPTPHTPVEDYVAPPRLGEHNDEIRRWLTKEHTP